MKSFSDRKFWWSKPQLSLWLYVILLPCTIIPVQPVLCSKLLKRLPTFSEAFRVHQCQWVTSKLWTLLWILLSACALFLPSLLVEKHLKCFSAKRWTGCSNLKWLPARWAAGLQLEVFTALAPKRWHVVGFVFCISLAMVSIFKLRVRRMHNRLQLFVKTFIVMKIQQMFPALGFVAFSHAVLPSSAFF